MKKLFIFILASVFCFGLFAAGPDIPIVEASLLESENDFDISNYYNYIDNTCTNIYSIVAIKDNTKKEYGIIFINNSCITDAQISLIYTFHSEKLFNTYLKNIDTLHLDKSFKEIREFFISKGVEPKNIYSENRQHILMQIYELPI